MKTKSYNSIKFLVPIFMLFICTSCFEPVEEIDFPQGKVELVIEAKITNEAGAAQVKISHTSAPSGDKVGNSISDAQVFVHHKNNKYPFYLSQNGTYLNDSLYGEPGTTFTLEVKYNNLTYTSTETMPSAPIIDTILPTKPLPDYLAENEYHIEIHGSKSSTEQQYYRVYLSINDTLKNGYLDMLLIEDSYLENKQFFVLPYVIKPGDIVMLEVHAISHAVFEYYYILHMMGNGEFGYVQPIYQNPPSNINNGALGCFQVNGVSRYIYRVPTQQNSN